MKKQPKISDAEWRVMQVFWSRGAATANQVVEALAGEEKWSDRTIRTLINRLVAKRALAHEPEGRQYVYRPLLGEEECVRAETRSFLGRISRSGLRPMLAAFFEEQAFSAADLKELKKILEKKKAK